MFCLALDLDLDLDIKYSVGSIFTLNLLITDIIIVCFLWITFSIISHRYVVYAPPKSSKPAGQIFFGYRKRKFREETGEHFSKITITILILNIVILTVQCIVFII